MKQRAIAFCAGLLLFALAASQIPGYADSIGYLWRASTGGRIRGRPVSTRDGVVYILSEDRHMYALEEHTGCRKWRTYLGGRVWDSLCIGADGTVYTVLKDGDLVAVGRGGGIAWKYKANGLPVGNPAAIVDGTVYFALDNGSLYAVSHTGRELWSVKLNAPPATGPAVGTNGDVYVGTVDRRVFAFSPSGEARWNALLAGIPTEPAISPEGEIYYGTDFGSIVAIDPAGDILWDYVSKTGFLAPILGKDRILTATAGGEVTTLDFEGNILWSRASGESLIGYLSVTAGNDLVALSGKGYLLRFRDDGEIVERFDVRGSGELFSVTPTGKIIFGREDWLVYAYRGSLPGDTAWPQPGGDAQHTSSALGRLESAGWLDAFRDKVEFIVLDNLVRENDPDLKSMALTEISEKIMSESRVPPYYLYFLAELASEGTLRASIESGTITNDYPQIRSEAVTLLGKVGTLQSADLLVRLLAYEYDSTATRKIIEAMGALMTDRDGRATEAIVRVVQKDLHGREAPDSRLAESALHALEAIQKYNGLMPHDSGEELIFDIYRGAYPKETRQLALDVLRRSKM